MPCRDAVLLVLTVDWALTEFHRQIVLQLQQLGGDECRHVDPMPLEIDFPGQYKT